MRRFEIIKGAKRIGEGVVWTRGGVDLVLEGTDVDGDYGACHYAATEAAALSWVLQMYDDGKRIERAAFRYLDADDDARSK